MLREEDKRHFRRYSSESACEIMLPSGTYPGRIIDYSDGAGVIIESTPEIEQGMEVYVKIIDHKLEFRGEVAWVGKADNHLRAGIRRTDNFRGNLRYFRLADILIGLSRCAKTGVLEIKSGPTEKKIFIDKGDMIYSSSSNQDDRLGEHLLKKGKITLTDFEKASYALMTTGKKLGKILVELCDLTPQELFGEVRHQIEGNIVSLFPLEEGEFEFQEGPISSDETITLQISTANIIYHGMKRINSFVFIRQMLPSSDDILNSSDNPLLIFQSLNLDSDDKKILSYVNGIYPLKTILSLSPSSDFETLKTISALMTIGLIYVKKEHEAPAELPVDEIFGEPEIPPPGYLEKIEGVFRKCEFMGHYDTLGVPEDASMEDIKNAYYQLLKQFHPDRHFAFQSPDIKEKLLKIVSHTTEAFEVLSDHEKRQEYDKTLSQKDLEKAVTPVMPVTRKEKRRIEASYSGERASSAAQSDYEDKEQEESAADLNTVSMTAGTEAEGEISAPADCGETDDTEITIATGVESRIHFIEEIADVHEKDFPEEESGRESEPVELPEDIISDSGTDEPATDKGNGMEEEVEPVKEPASVAGTGEDETAEEEEGDVGLVVSMVARESERPGKKWSYYPVALIIMILLVVAIPLVNKKLLNDTVVQEHISSPSHRGLKKTYLPPFRDDLFNKMTLHGGESGDH